MARIESDGQFWKAIELTNKSLESSGLYLSHLFTDRQIALTPNGLDRIVAIPSGGYRFLLLFRPSSLDLILTKMMRNDREDLEDIRFIISQGEISQSELDMAFASSRPLEAPELRTIFVGMQPVVRKIALEMNSIRNGKSRSESTAHPVDPDWWSKLTRPPTVERDKGKDREVEL